MGALALYDIENNLDAFRSLLREDELLQFIWKQFKDHPVYLARALVKARPEIFYAYGFAYRLILKLRANLGPVLLLPHRPLRDPDPRVFLKELPASVERDIITLLTEAKFREHLLWFMSRDISYALESLEEIIRSSANQWERIVFENIRDQCERLLSMKFPGFVEQIVDSPFPSFHVRWWLDLVKDVPRVLNVGDIGKQKT